MSQVLSRQDANVAPIARPWFVLVAYLIVTGMLYRFVTHRPLGPVEIIPASALDQAIPVLPGTVPLYLTYLFVMPALVWLGRGRAWLLPAFFAGALAAGLCLTSHLLHPTAIVWPTADTGWIAWLQRLDTPLAASPSGHIALPVAIASVLLALRKRPALLFVAWSALLAATVLTTGQHRVADVAAGGTVGLTAGALTIALLRLRANLRTTAALLIEWACIVVALRVAIALDAWYLTALAALVVATRQHALFILYHDAAHYHLARGRGLNDFLINLAIGVPGLVPVEFYRPLHLAHHRHLGTAQDPERRFLYHGQPWRFRPLDALALARQLLGDLFVLNMVRNMAAFRRAGAPPVRLGRPFHAAAAVWVAIVALLVWACSARTMLLVAALWFVPLLTLSVLLQKIRSMAEHSGGPDATPGWSDWTYSWRTGWIGRVLVWPYHINLHLQHHRNPSIPWHALPEAVGSNERRLESRELVALLWRGRPVTERRAATFEQPDTGTRAADADISSSRYAEHQASPDLPPGHAAALPRMPGIQVLRGVAILLVLIQHYLLALPDAGAAVDKLSLWGGVDLFFAISGFVISRSLLAGCATDRIDGATWRAFWIRRIGRLLPAAWTWLAIGIALGFTLTAFGRLDTAAQLRATAAGAFGYANLFWAGCHASGTAAQCGLPQLTAIYWSLSLEEQFYVVLATALLVVRLRTLIIVSLTGVALLNTLSYHALDLRWFLRVDALVLGAGVYAFHRTQASRRLADMLAVRSLMSPARIALLAILVCAPLISARAPIAVIALAAAGLVWLEAAGDHRRGVPRPGRFSVAMRWVGERAYSIYLCHLPVLLVTYEILWRAGGFASVGGSQLALAGIGSLSAIALIASLSYRYLEQPGIRWSQHLTRPATEST
ncbi:fatty acid desaturase [Burkholderia pyrrocinia]|uniref:fatty acid desaturase n=1 Tax=Burkholderia pyrrocinia TaxID=60550 RepID=UPI00157745D5|nr:fatty acid desaturase [Burkholderia pyrrocinia]NTX29247.1 fatty acid desaturase [Burkholderia pyrrocinia]